MVFDPSKYGAVRVDETTLTEPTTNKFDPTKYGAVRVDETPVAPTPITPVETGRNIPTDIGIGIGKGALSTITGASGLGEKILNSFWKTVLPKSAEKAMGIDKAPTLGIIKKSADVKTSAKKLQSQTEQKLGLKEGQLTTPQNTAQKVGFYGEQIGEFFIPGAASAKLGKAASVATKGSKLAKGAASLATRAASEGVIAGGQMALQQGGIDKEVGATALLSSAFPVAGKLLSKTVKPVASKVSERVMNSLIKPLMRDLQYEKNPSKGLLKYVGSFNSYEDAIKKTDDVLAKLSEEKANIVKNPLLNTEKLSFADDIDNIFAEAQQKAKYDENALKRLQAAKENIIYDVSVDSTGNKILGAKRDLNNLTLEEASKIQKEIGEMRTWLGFAKEEQAADKALGRIYGTIKQKTNKLADDYGVNLKEVNEGISDLVTAKKVLKHRDEVLKRQNIFNLPTKIGTYGLSGIGVLTGNPLVLLSGLGIGAIDKALGSAAFKTRLANTLAKLGAEERSALINKTPGLRQIFNRIFGENLPETIDEQKVIQKIDDYLRKQPKYKLLPAAKADTPRAAIELPEMTETARQASIKSSGILPQKSPNILSQQSKALATIPKGQLGNPIITPAPTIIEKGVKSPSDLRTSLPIKKSVAKVETNPLIQEAKKYKSAEEFVKEKTKPHYINIKEIKSSFDADTFSNLKGIPRNQNINLLNEYKSTVKRVEKSPVGREITKPISVEFNVDGGDGYRILDGNHRYLQALKNGDKRILVKFDVLKGTSQEGKNIFQNKTKSQLTDIWNKANKGLPIKKTNPTVGKTIKKLTSTQLDDIVSQINSGGITYDLAKKQGLGGQPYYAVSVYPERSKLFNGKIKKKDILQYVKDNLDLLSKKNHTLGGWYDTESKQLYLDVTSAIKDKNKAIDLGKKYNQKKIFDLLNFKEIDTGGTGENIKDFGDIIERIKLIESL